MNKIKCKWCGGEIELPDAIECNHCWELRHRIELTPKLAKKIIRQFQKEKTSCPVCGYYCLGKGGIGCIDKPKELGVQND
jgi:hypothetical protein